MTIRLKCPECQQKLKVADEALGKKVQCPVCGARFVGRIESSPSPASPVGDRPAAVPEDIDAPTASAAEESGENAAVVDLLFSDVASLHLEEAIPPAESPPASLSAESEGGEARTEAPPASIGPLEPFVWLEGNPPDVSAEEELMAAPAAGPARPAKKQSGKTLFWVGLAGILVVGLLGCGGAGFVAYRFFTD